MSVQATAPNPIIWFDNHFVRLAEANVSVLTHALNYGTGLFEGIRGYYEPHSKDLLLFRMYEHYDRWKRNCRILRINVPLTIEQLMDLTAELCRRNDFRSHVYVRPLAYKSSARLGVAPDSNDAFSITVLASPEYLIGKPGLKAGVSSWRRLEDTAIPSRAKICGAYVNSALAIDEAKRNGHDEAIFLNENGHVAEGGASNLFLIRNGKLITPPPSDNILEGITRATVMELAHHEINIEVVERSIDRSELYICDELFLTGTMVELAPILEVDHRPVGSGEVGPITRELKRVFADVTRGRIPAYEPWNWPVYSSIQNEKTA
jgi:branched-chain amino acid aminotransferase